MILVDTSVWVDYLRRGDEELRQLLESGRVCTHPFVIGEIACGNLVHRATVLELLNGLPAVRVVSDSDILSFIEDHGLMGRGIGYIDIHLLAAVVSGASIRLWTRDKRLHALAESLGVSF
ncbi:MAG: PIN domain-containing protein [Zetaproteobacteria bacterium]|nr:MAG: PIN domain-containing protein [Zetaproteobacteria bacterium]